jgi:predicted RNase H-like HicB family nuclease
VVELTTYAVTFELDGDGLWLADVPALRGAHTQGRTLATARERIREVIAMVEDLDDETAIELEERIELPPRVEELVAKAAAAGDEAARQLDRALAYRQEAAQALVEIVGLSTRDAGDVLGISHGRVHQLVAHPGSGKSEAAALALGRAIGGRKTVAPASRKTDPLARRKTDLAADRKTEPPAKTRASKSVTPPPRKKARASRKQ